MKVEQFVMAYGADQDRLRAMMPEGFDSLRPVLRINAEIRGDAEAYLEFNVPVSCGQKRGWLNIANWNSVKDGLTFSRKGKAVTFRLPFLKITYTATGATGGCPAEKDNDGCYFLNDEKPFRKTEKIDENKEFCDCEFAWSYAEGDAAGVSQGKTIPAFNREQKKDYGKVELTPQNAAAIPCEQVLGSYVVSFERA
ncbi:MAG: hypothetical protein ACOX4I_05595 [Anaerovoracaceae bacterium]|jgi:hypothetical protein